MWPWIVCAFNKSRGQFGPKESTNSFSKENLECLAFEKNRETEVNEKFRSDQELLELKKLYASLDKEQAVIDNLDTSPEKCYNPSIKGNVYPDQYGSS